MITAGVTSLWMGGGVMTTGAIGADTIGVASGDLIYDLVTCVLIGGIIHYFELGEIPWVYFHEVMIRVIR